MRLAGISTSGGFISTDESGLSHPLINILQEEIQSLKQKKK